MELDWTTFLLEVINFLILAWLLKRFLYQPVLNVIEKRRQKISADLLQAQTTQGEAEALKEQYETRLVDWEHEKRAAQESLERDLARMREHKLKQLDQEIEQQRLTQQASEQRQQALWRSQVELEALQLGSSFAARLLQDLAGPETDDRLRELFIRQLARLPPGSLDRLRDEWERNSPEIEVISAAPLEEKEQRLVREALERTLGPGAGSWQFRNDGDLIAGLRVSIGEWMLQANLQDELRFFSEVAHGE